LLLQILYNDFKSFHVVIGLFFKKLIWQGFIMQWKNKKEKVGEIKL